MSMLLPSPFDKKGKFFWPGSFQDCSELIKVIPSYQNTTQLFELLDFEPEILEKIKQWSFLEICCSLYYYYFDTLFFKRKLRNEPLIRVDVWSNAAFFILNSKISLDFSAFINQLGLPTQSSKNSILDGIIYCLNYTKIDNDIIYSKSSFKNLLSLVNISERKSTLLIEKSFAQKSTVPIVNALLELKKSNNSSVGLTNLLKELNLTPNQVKEVAIEIQQLCEDRALLNITELSDFDPVDILTSSDGSIGKAYNLKTLVNFNVILSDIIDNDQTFSLEIFQLFEVYFSNKLENARTLEEKQNILNQLPISEVVDLITDFYQTEKTILLEKVQTNLSVLQEEVRALTPKQIISSILLASAYLLIITGSLKPNKPLPQNYQAPLASMTTRSGARFLSRTSEPSPTIINSAATPEQRSSVDTGQTQRTTRSAKRNLTLSNKTEKLTLQETPRAQKRVKLGNAQVKRNSSKNALSAATQANLEKAGSVTSDQIDEIKQELKAEVGSTVTVNLHPVGDSSVLSLGSTHGCYNHARLANTIFKNLLDRHTVWLSMQVQPMDADHMLDKPTLKSFGMEYSRASSMLISVDTHTAKNKVDFTRSADIKTVADYIISHGEKTFEFICSLPEDIFMQNGASKETFERSLKSCIAHDYQMFLRAGLDNEEGLFVGDTNRAVTHSTTSITNFTSKIDRNSSNLSPTNVETHLVNALQKSSPIAELVGTSSKLVTRSQNRLVYTGNQFKRSMTDLIDMVKQNCYGVWELDKVQNALTDWETNLKRGDINSPTLEQTLSLLPEMTESQASAIPNNANVTSNSRMEWLGSKTQIDLSKNQEDKGKGFTPPYSPPFT